MHSDDSRGSVTSSTDDQTPLGIRSDAAAAFECADSEAVGAEELVTVTTVVGGEDVDGPDVAVEAAPFATLESVAVAVAAEVELELPDVELPTSVIRLLAVGAASPLAEKTTADQSPRAANNCTAQNSHSKLPDFSASSTACWKS